MKPNFELSPESRLIRQYLRTVEVGEIATYDKLSHVIGRPLDHSSSMLRSAVNALIKDDRVMFACIRTVGYRRLPDADIISHADTDIDGIRRKARRGARKLTCVQDYEALTPQKQLAHTSRLSVLTMVAYTTTDQGLKKVETAATGKKGELPLSETVRAFMK
jgi:hypothetical protein